MTKSTALADILLTEWQHIRQQTYDYLDALELINFLFCHRLPIPPSWADEWALRYDD